MVNKETSKKAIALAFSAILVILIFTVLIPPIAGVELSIGSIVDNDVNKGQKITFSDVNITIDVLNNLQGRQREWYG